MKIAHLEASKGWGGQEIRILKESLALRKRGYEIIFILAKGGKFVLEGQAHGFKIYELNFTKKNWIYAFFRLIFILKKENIHLVNTHSSLDAWIGGAAARFLSLPIVRTRHLSTKVKKGWNSKIVYNYLADFVVTTCEKIIPILSQQSNKSIEKFQSVPTGINPKEMIVDDKQVESFREQYHIKKNDILIGTVCFMRSWKGIEDFLQAALILQKEPNLKWVIIGSGHSETYVRRAQELNLENKIIFTGHLNPPFHAIKALDIFVLLSTANEGVSQASLQAAFLKKPLITTPTGGLCEVCLDQQTGISVPCFSPKKVSDAILTLKKYPDLRKKYGDNAHDLVKQKFYFENTINNMEEIYCELK